MMRDIQPSVESRVLLCCVRARIVRVPMGKKKIFLGGVIMLIHLSFLVFCAALHLSRSLGQVTFVVLRR